MGESEKIAMDFEDFNLVSIGKKYPLLIQNLSHLANGEEYLRRIWALEQRWKSFVENPKHFDEIVIFDYEPRNVDVERGFDIIYAGGTLGLLHATLMSLKYSRRVLVFDAFKVGKTHRDWNISDEELQEFVKSGLFTQEELQRAIVNRYRYGFVKFYDANSKVKAPPFRMENVLNVAIDADKLLSLASEKIRNTNSKIVDYLKLTRVYVLRHEVLVECEEVKTKRKRFFAGRLLIDATGTNSNISRQLNSGCSITHVCPTVGTVAKGFERGFDKNEVDFSVGEILVSTEDITDGRQLIWEGFAGDPLRDEYTTYLFFYDSVDSSTDKSLFRLFEEYFEKLPQYKARGGSWRVVKPVFGYIPSFHHKGWRNLKQVAVDRVLLMGDAAGLSSPLTFCGFGSFVRNFRKLTTLTQQALESNELNQSSLSNICAYESNVAQMASLAEFMRPTPKSKPSVVNETMNAVMMALSKLEPEIARELFQDRMRFASFKQLLIKTATLHPKVFKLMFEHLGIKGAFWWIANILEAFLDERKLDFRAIGNIEKEG